MDHKEVKRYLNVIKRATAYIEAMLDNTDDGLLEKMLAPQPATPSVIQIEAPQQELVVVPLIQEAKGPSPEEVAQHQRARKKHIEDLMAIDCWPEAMPSFFTSKEPSVSDQINRANAVLDMMVDRSMEGMNFLDFGCGEGWITQEACKRGVIMSTGYDIVEHANWSNLSGPVMTCNLASIKNNHYDVVFLYDVLDHCKDPIMLMDEVRQHMRKDGVVYVRCHPWTSRHASHLFKKGLNKAYIHLFLNWGELAEIIHEGPMFTREEKNPIEAYMWWFKDFEIKKERFIKEPVSEFFYVDSFKELLASEQQIPLADIDGFLELMKVQFADYVIFPK